MSNEYKIKKRKFLSLSERQSEELATLWALLVEMRYGSLRGAQLPNLNSEWLSDKIKTFGSISLHQQIKIGESTDYGVFKVTRAKKGYVIRINMSWRAKGEKTAVEGCLLCKKKKPLDKTFRCKDCKGKRFKW